VPDFLVERYMPPSDLADVDGTTDRIRHAVASEQERGDPIHYVRSIVVAADETSFWLFTAEKEESVRRVLDKAGVTFERIVEAEL